MSEANLYIQKLFSGSNITISGDKAKMFNEFVAGEDNVSKVKQIKELQNSIMRNWQLITRIKDIQDQQVSIPNATVGKEYSAKIDFLKLGWNDVVFSEFESLEKFGLEYSNESEILSGIPSQSGDFKIKLLFRIQGEEDNSTLNEKSLSFIINADPKSLWKDVPSIKEDEYWKEDNSQDFQPLGDKHIVVASKRGRSHANVGSFRDDDYAFKYFENSGWSVATVSDGAGSAKLSRKGSELACKTVIDYFENTFTDEVAKEFDSLIAIYERETKQKSEPSVEASKSEAAVGGPTIVDPIIEAAGDPVIEVTETPAPVKLNEIVTEKIETNSAKISKFIYYHLGNAARTVHKTLEAFAAQKEIALKELHSTLIFTLFKKYEFGYVILSFGVGDCPI